MCYYVYDQSSDAEAGELSLAVREGRVAEVEDRISGTMVRSASFSAS